MVLIESVFGAIRTMGPADVYVNRSCLGDMDSRRFTLFFMLSARIEMPISTRGLYHN
jgi:hypothetical protein